MKSEPVSQRSIPFYPLSDYVLPDFSHTGVYVGRIEESLARHSNRRRVHRHEHFELFWLSGAGLHFNDFADYPLRGRTLIIASPGQVHGWPRSSSLRGTMIGFTTAFFDGRECPPSALAQYGFALGGGLPPVVRVKAADADPLDSLTGLIEREFATRGPNWIDAIRYAVRILFVLADRVYREAHPEPILQSRAAELTRQFRVSLEHRFRTTTSVSAHARALGVTAGHLNETLRAETGRGAGELIRERVLLEAKRLLLHSQLSVSEIAYHLGFDDPSYFARFFRRETEQAPAAFRETIHEKYRQSLD